MHWVASTIPWLDKKRYVGSKLASFQSRFVLTPGLSGTGTYDSKETSQSSHHPNRPSPNRQNYLAILVTTPPIHNYGPVSEHLYRTRPDKPGRIPWASTDTDSIPPMLASLVFRRHFAVCLVTEEAWKCSTTTLREKLTGQLFWDHCGGSGGKISGSRGSTWSSGRVSQINALQVLGAVVVGDQDAAEACTCCKSAIVFFNTAI